MIIHEYPKKDGGRERERIEGVIYTFSTRLIIGEIEE
jgi:hypothetical protein